MNRPEAGTVPRGHVLVEALDGSGTAKLAELLVHVVCTGARVVAEPDAEVLDLQRLLLVDLGTADDKCAAWSAPIPPAT